MNPDLDLIETDHLITELSKRFDSIVFAGMQRRDSMNLMYHYRINGGHVPAMGLVEYLKIRVRQSLFLTETDKLPPWMEE